MGTFGDGSNAKKGKSRGATNVARSLAGLGAAKDSPGSADWAVCEPAWIRAVVVETTRRGGMVSFGMSRDKGAYKVTIFLDGEKRDIWVSGSEDISAKMEEVAHYMASLGLD